MPCIVSEPKIYELGMAANVKNGKHSDYGNKDESTETWFKVVCYFKRVSTEEADKERNNEPSKGKVTPSYVTQHFAKLYAIALEALKTS